MIVKCAHCHKPIGRIVTNCFEPDGSDYDYKFPIYSSDGKAVSMDLPLTWCGFGLNEEEMMDGIRCPHCGKFLFDRLAGLQVRFEVSCLTKDATQDEEEE